MNIPAHEPVLLAEVLEILRPQRGGVYLDATVGLGGHAQAILEESTPSGCLIALDRDPDAVAFVRQRLADYGERVKVFHASFDALEAVLQKAGVEEVEGVLMDLGMSSYQLDASGRGFSFRWDEPLDMRMDPTRGITAEELLRRSDTATLEFLFRVYGEERYSWRLAEAITARRRREPLRTTSDLVRLIEEVLPPRTSRIHPATRIFQALRIAVNDELRQLEEALPQALRRLCVGGTLIVIAFHSLEDRIVKRVFREATQTVGEFESVTKKPWVPSEEERRRNPRSRSAKLRALRRLHRPKSS